MAEPTQKKPLFADLAPPPHGLLRLRARRRRRHPVVIAGLVLGPVVSAAVVLVALLRAPAPAPTTFDHPALAPDDGGVSFVVDGQRIGALRTDEGVWLVPASPSVRNR